MIGDDFDAGFSRHLRNLGFVPPEFQSHQRFDTGEPSDKSYIWNTTPRAMKDIMPMREWQAIEEAAIFAHRLKNGNNVYSEHARRNGGYNDLGIEEFRIPDQRPLLQGGDNDPED